MSFSLTRLPTGVSGASLPLSFGAMIDANLGTAPGVWEVTAAGLRVLAPARTHDVVVQRRRVTITHTQHLRRTLGTSLEPLEDPAERSFAGAKKNVMISDDQLVQLGGLEPPTS